MKSMASLWITLFGLFHPLGYLVRGNVLPFLWFGAYDPTGNGKLFMDHHIETLAALVRKDDSDRAPISFPFLHLFPFINDIGNMRR